MDSSSSSPSERNSFSKYHQFYVVKRGVLPNSISLEIGANRVHALDFNRLRHCHQHANRLQPSLRPRCGVVLVRSSANPLRFFSAQEGTPFRNPLQLSHSNLILTPHDSRNERGVAHNGSDRLQLGLRKHAKDGKGGKTRLDSLQEKREQRIGC